MGCNPWGHKQSDLSDLEGTHIVDLQCVLVSDVLQSDSVIYVNICLCIFSGSFMDYYRVLSIVPCAIQ